MGRGQEKPGWTPDTDKDLVEIWPQVLQKYEEVTKEKLSPKTTFAEFQTEIERHIARSSTKSHQNTRKVLNHVGFCLQQFGDIIAQGASIVFGPASQCWNAISFVIQAGRKFSEILEGFVVLMERSAVFLERLNFYLRQECDQDGSKLPHRLRKPAYGILSDFLGVLASSYSLTTSKKERWKTMVGVVLFNSDAGVATSLSRMEQCVQDFTDASVDQILADVKGLALYLRHSDEERARRESEILKHLQGTDKIIEQVLAVNQQMKLTQDGRTTKKQHEEEVEKIRKRLTPQHSIEQVAWDKRHDELCKNRLKDTGKWLEGNGLGFTQWAHTSHHGKNLFLLRGDSGFGKTYISNYAISYLQNKYRTVNRPTPVRVAYYYYGADKDDSLEKCLGSIIYQFAKEDIGYAAAVANACGRPEATAKAEDLWTHLLQGLEDRMKGVYFICIDGIDDHGQSDEMMATIFAIVRYIRSQDVSKDVCLRLFVSGSFETPSAILQDAGNGRTFAVNLGQGLDGEIPREDGPRPIDLSDSPRLNADDIDKITKARVLEVCNIKPDLKGILDQSNPAGRSNIRILIESIHGNFLQLEAKVAAIIACDTERKVLDVITNSSDDVSTFQRNSLKALDSSLDSTQIRVLNELLVWVSGTLGNPTGRPGLGFPSAKFLQSALYLAMGENYFPESEIATTYSTLLKIDKSKSSKVTFKSDETKDILRTSSAPDVDAASGDRNTEQISRAEVDLCRRFIKNACDSVDYTRFKFDEFFDAMVHKSHIRLDDDDTVNVAIIRSCVDALHADRQDENLRELRSYASNFFYLHIWKLTERLGDFDPVRDFFTDVGAKVLDLLYEPERIDAWVSQADLHRLRRHLLMPNFVVDALLMFLKNPHVAKGYTRDARKREWIKSIIAEPANRTRLLERVAAHLAGQWFGRTTHVNQEYLFLSYSLVAQQSGDLEEGWTPYKPTLQELEHYLQWVKTHVNHAMSDHAWQYRVGASMLACGHYKQAIVAFKEAESHFQSNWDLTFGLVAAYWQLNDPHTSLEYIHKFKALSSQYETSDKGYREAHWKVLFAEGSCYTQLEDFDLAVEIYTRILSKEWGEGPNSNGIRMRSILRLFVIWSQAKTYASIIDFVRGWKKADAAGRDYTYWLSKIARNDKIHGHIIAAAKYTGAVDEMCDLYQAAIDCLTSELDASKKPYDAHPSSVAPYLQFFQAALRVYASVSEIDHDRGIRHWENVVRSAYGVPGELWTVDQASQILAPRLLDKAIADKSMPSSSSSESYVSRLDALTSMRTDRIRGSQDLFDPRLCLARFFHLKGDRDLAFVRAQERLCSVFDKWPGDPFDVSLVLRYKNLAPTLTVLDKDVDAIAAWQAIRPYAAPESNSDDSAIVNDKTPASDSRTLVELEINGETTRVVPIQKGPKSKAYITRYGCDGSCGTWWFDVLAEIYVCRNCYCVQLCQACHKKLQDDELHPMVCNKSHKMLYLPPFDKELWQTLPADMMIVDKRPVARVDWLNRLRDEFQVQQEQIEMIKIEKARELKAASVIAVQWRNRLLKIRARTPLASPATRRAKIVG